MNTQTLKQSEAQNGSLKQGLTLLNTMVKRFWRYRKGLQLQFESDNVSSWTLKGTAYSIVREQGVYFSVIGQHRVSNTFTKIDDCIKDAKRMDEHKVMQLATMICDIRMKNLKK